MIRIGGQPQEVIFTTPRDTKPKEEKCPECGSQCEPIDDLALAWECPECGRMFRIQDPEGIERLKKGAFFDNNKITKGGRIS